MNVPKTLQSAFFVKVSENAGKPRLLVAIFSRFISISVCGFIFATSSIAADEDSADQDAVRTEAEERFFEMRVEAVKKWDGGFFLEEKFTPEQIQLFITTRIAAEDRVMARLRQTPGAVLLPSLVATELDSANADAFTLEIAQRYREWVNTKNVWMFIMDDSILNARGWLTAEELTYLAQAWGPILAISMDTAYQPAFVDASPNERLALHDQVMEKYISAAKQILDAAQFSKLKERFAEMRLAAIKEFESPSE